MVFLPVGSRAKPTLLAAGAAQSPDIKPIKLKVWPNKPVFHCDLWIVTSYCSQFFNDTSDATQTSNSASSIHNWTKLWIKSIGAIHLGLVTSLYPQNKQNKRFIAQWRWRGPDVNLAVAQQLSSSCTPPSPEIKYSNTRWSKWN